MSQFRVYVGKFPNFSTHGFYGHSEKKKKKGLVAMLVFLILFVQIKVGKFTKVMLINILGIAKGWERWDR